MLPHYRMLAGHVHEGRIRKKGERDDLYTHRNDEQENAGGGRSSLWTPFRATVLLAACLLIAGLPPSTIGAAETTTCSTAISNNPGLVSDREALLSVRDTLAGTTGDLNWSAALAMDA